MTFLKYISCALLLLTCLLNVNASHQCENIKQPSFNEFLIPARSNSSTQATEKFVTVNAELSFVCKEFIAIIADVTGLEIVNVSVHGIEAGAFEAAPKLRELSLANNEITQIASGVFSNLNISKINLRKNNIAVVASKTFDQLVNLEDLDLSSNSITELKKDWFVGCPKLQRIRLFTNNIVEISGATFENLNPTLPISLLLGGNKIGNIEKAAFDKLVHVQELTLHDNRIKELPEDFLKNAEDIALLDLGSNQITCISEEVLKKATDVFFGNDPIDEQCVAMIKSAIKKYKVEVYSQKIKIEIAV